MRVLFATLGTFGDLQPYLGISEELLRRGHDVSLATSENHRAAFLGSGVKFIPIPPNIIFSDLRYFDYNNGYATFMKEALFPAYLKTFFKLKEAAQQHDVLISSKTVIPASDIVAETGILWIEGVFAPISMGLPQFPHWPYPDWAPSHYSTLEEVAPLFLRISQTMEKRKNYRQYNAGSTLKLGFFSKYLAGARDYWHHSAKTTGFIFHKSKWPLPENLQDFLTAGSPPLIMSIGSCLAGICDVEFYRPFIKAAGNLKKRIVILAGKHASLLQVMVQENKNVFVIDAAPNERIFPYAETIIHHGGAGTTGQALKAGKPSLVIPFCYDQPTNAFYLEQRGVGKHVLQQDCRIDIIQNTISDLGTNSTYANNAKALSNLIQSENGVQSACDEIENSYNKRLQYSNIRQTICHKW